MRIRKITCNKCGVKISGKDLTFEEISIHNDWEKTGNYYICGKCKKFSKKSKGFKTNDSFNVDA